jgi:hypothetical protein
VIWFKFKICLRKNWLEWISDSLTIGFLMAILFPISIFSIFYGDLKDDNELLDFMILFSCIFILTFVLVFGTLSSGWILATVISTMISILNMISFCMAIKIASDVYECELTLTEKRDYLLSKF